MRAYRRGSFSESKIKGLKDLSKIISDLKAKGKRIVLTNGCFDILHYGHTKYLEEAKTKADVLVVGINSDASVKRIKGNKRPIIKEDDRARVVAALESVDYVVLFKEDTPFNIIKLLKPDVLVKGADWDRKNIVGADLVLGYGGRVVRIKLAKGSSTTGIIEKIAQNF